MDYEKIFSDLAYYTAENSRAIVALTKTQEENSRAIAELAKAQGENSRAIAELTKMQGEASERAEVRFNRIDRQIESLLENSKLLTENQIKLGQKLDRLSDKFDRWIDLSMNGKNR